MRALIVKRLLVHSSHIVLRLLYQIGIVLLSFGEVILLVSGSSSSGFKGIWSSFRSMFQIPICILKFLLLFNLKYIRLIHAIVRCKIYAKNLIYTVDPENGHFRICAICVMA